MLSTIALLFLFERDGVHITDLAVVSGLVEGRPAETVGDVDITLGVVEQQVEQR